ncbi:hypothetical protein [Roseomonas sp. CECT 9278]|uniref:hypothetical protein n=1 Tax=Roseomonas sp. CECT 9278 TaxID=2845823 RepID=UPI001E4E14E2|nr:hypothetical protein [Roseomonas sp. CECT 9278]CAH0290598.1 hypothetical protein ROS9278_04216 [Roseomonas sp. CECT 9278]
MAPPILVTIATQRSGTKFLGACLNGGDAVRSFSEPFKPPPPTSPFAAFAVAWMARQPGFAFRDTEIAAMLDAFLDTLAAEAAAQGRIAHLDVMYNNLGAFTGAWTWPVRPAGESTLCRVLRARGARIIHLVRDSLADCVASTLIAEQRGYHRRTPLPPGDPALRLTADLAAAERQMRDILAARAFVRRAFRGHDAWVELAYPDFIDGQALAPQAAARLAGLAGLPAGRAVAGPCPLHPTAPDRAMVVTNWDALVALEARMRAAG